MNNGSKDMRIENPFFSPPDYRPPFEEQTRKSHHITGEYNSATSCLVLTYHGPYFVRDVELGSHPHVLIGPRHQKVISRFVNSREEADQLLISILQASD